ncbi:hypothetical protein EJ04DRAFT_512091 [Polyplosphaeria fusca]|uniref:Proteasome inhibitor PI31 subunit n=1 Tax=Polyplosphaeria fusca TaxID=682080 RepID=A0A9P4R170_9PLEO|nr:hypothetical protein EJ04DRAFT_512091 [Polyplosphaeria fusca]
MSPINAGGNPLSAGSLATFMAASLPRAATSQVKNPYEAVGLAAHAGMIAIGFRLIGLGEDDRIEASADAHDPQPLPSEWNASNSYAFRYAHSQSAMEYLIKVSRLGGKAIVMGLAVGDDKTATFEVVVKDYLSESSLPLDVPADISTESLSSKLQETFISPSRLSDFGALFKISIIQKLAPGLQKEGYEDTGEPSTRPQARNRSPPLQPNHPPQEPDPARPYPFYDPLAAPPRNPDRPLPEPIPRGDDELDMYRHRPNPLRDDRSYGHSDLYPPGLGPNDPLRPHLGGGLPRPGGFGGMHPTFDDPLFRGQGQGGYDPQVPPGARYDPAYPNDPHGPQGGLGGFPGGGPFGGPRGGPRGGPGGFGGPPNPFSGFGDGDFI